jgi:glucan 1,3-beta-glucosidase
MSRPSTPASETLRASVAHDTAAGDWQRGHQQVRSGAAPPGDGIEKGSWSRHSSSPEVWTPSARDALTADFRATLAHGVHGLCFSPYLEGQQPGSQVSEAQVRERLAILQPHAGWVRTFSCTDGHEQTPRIAHELGLKTLVGAWLGTDVVINEREIQGVIEVARAGHADIVAVGNEVMLREDMSEDDLLGFVQRVKDALPSVPVGYVDAYFLFEKHPRITAACDVVMTNCYPFWEGCPRDQALAYMQTMLARTRAAAPGKRVLISETGWPDQGSPFEGSVPSREGAMQYFVDTAGWARDEGIELFYFSAFDEAWKVGTEGDVGAYWGLWDAHGQPKFQGTDKDGELKFG